MKITSYQCPLCNDNLHSELGSTLHPLDPAFGVSVFCRNLKCPAQEVAGHGKSEKEAFEIVQSKYKK